MRMTPDLFLYITATLMALWTIADRYAPYEGLSDAGCRIDAVLDGDTLRLICNGTAETARLTGFDTPETRDARCEAERALGKQAAAYLRDWVRRAQPGISDQGHDKYRRRLIRLRLDGQDVAARMIGQGLAVPYTGAARIDWCARLKAGTIR
ncbi:thermonuclease family protein [Gemmobacter serpentinus]|uniref:thermonuclease family protein n=1 Tax=Gemmobacter serpentinus TaxID=2652247 RepID=UPI00124D2FDE|nr:thermonuclease family protein [Gemmobacter serpentinus]